MSGVYWIRHGIYNFSKQISVDKKIILKNTWLTVL